MPPKNDDKATDGKAEAAPAALAAGAYELQKPRAAPKDAIWAKVDGDGSATQIRNADPTLDYRILDTAQYPPDGRALYAARQRLTDRGFDPISGLLYKGSPRREFVGVPTAEIWARSIDLDDEEFLARLAKSCLSAQYANYYWRRCVAEGAPEKRWLPEPLEYAMLVHHGLQHDTKRLMTRPGAVPDVERERTIIINLVRKVKVHPRGSQPDPVREAFAEFKG